MSPNTDSYTVPGVAGAFASDGTYYPSAGFDDQGRWWWGGPIATLTDEDRERLGEEDRGDREG